MPQDGSNNYQYPPGTPGIPDQTIESEAYNTFLDDLVTNDLNIARPVHRGGTGANNASQALVNLGGEKTTQLVTNYDSHVWYPGSFRSSNATGQGAPVDGHAFAGIAYINEPLVFPPTNQNVVIEARDQGDTVVPGRLYVREKKAGVWSAWVEQVGNSADLAVALFRRNRIVNGAMQISQENGNTISVASGSLVYFPADQWQLSPSIAPGAFTAQRVQVITPNGSTDRIRAVVTTAKAPAAGDVAQIFYSQEGNTIADFCWGSASARQSILRFGWKSPAGTYSFAIRNSTSNRSYVANFTISAGQANTDTEQLFIIPGDVTGTWLTDTGIGLSLRIAIATGTTQQGVSGWQAGNFIGTSSNTNGMATIGNTFELFDVGLYLDADNTGVAPKWEMPDPVLELYRCQRYWQKLTATVVGGYNVIGNAVDLADRDLQTEMRTAPTVAFSAITYSNCSGLSLFGATTKTWGVNAGITATGYGYVTFSAAINARM